MMFYTDHSVVVCKLNCLKPPPSKVLVNYQAITVIFTLISSALTYWTLSNNLLIQKDLHVSVEDYNTALNIQRLFYSLSTIDQERLGLVAKREKRRLDKMFRKSHLTVHRQLFMLDSALDSVKSDYFKAKIDQVTTGYLKLLSTVHLRITGFTMQPSMILWIPCLKISITLMYLGFGTSGVS